MGRTTFEPALSNDRWPWPNLNVFVLVALGALDALELVVLPLFGAGCG